MSLLYCYRIYSRIIEAVVIFYDFLWGEVSDKWVITSKIQFIVTVLYLYIVIINTEKKGQGGSPPSAVSPQMSRDVTLKLEYKYT